MTSFVRVNCKVSREDNDKTSKNGYREQQYKGNINYDQCTVRAGGYIERNTSINVKITLSLDGEAILCLLMATWAEIIQKLPQQVPTTQKNSLTCFYC